MLALLLAAAVAPATVEVAVLDHALRKGDRVEAADLRADLRPAMAAHGALAAGDAAGMEAARALPAGAILRATDLVRPQLIRRGEPVTIRIVTGALSIATAGRALGGGAKGDAVRVVANSTNRTLDGRIEAAGSVRVMIP
ncbi:MAG: flagellar basal body P-ring formation chaperone FlgA [Sphingomonas bacterium]